MKFLLLTLSFLLSLVVTAAVHAASDKPNIIFILADDLGYGDVHCLNPERCKIATPQMDQLAAQGMVFTDAHSSSSVCTPTRYGILTGRYNWRSRLQNGVLYGFDQPLIPSDRLTVAGFLKTHDYRTAAIGKWHLGLGLPTTDGKTTGGQRATNVDWKGRISGGPVELGFDYYYGISASLDMPPYIYIENDRFVGECTTTKAFHRKGPAHADFEAVDVLPEIGRQSVEYIRQQNADEPFFMYIALTSPHTPIAPSDDWKGNSELGVYGDFVMHTDAVIGEIVSAVNASGFAENTMIVVTSDNGCSAKPSKAKELEQQGHYSSAEFRGYKSDLWDGGHRVPFIVRWPAKVDPGSVSDQTICLTDLMATSAELAGSKLPETAGEDSVSFASALKGDPMVTSRKGVIHHSIGGKFAYRQGKWKLLLATGSGGWTKEKMPADTVAQLYDMTVDPGEQNNLYNSHPEVAQRLLAQLQTDVKRGRSTDGPELSNDVPVKLKMPGLSKKGK